MSTTGAVLQEAGGNRSAPGSGRPPRLLLLAHYFPPVHTIGAVRAFEMAKWLTRKGWEVTVVTPTASVWSRVENPERVQALLSREGIRCMRTGYPFRQFAAQGLVAEAGRAWRWLPKVARRLQRPLHLDGEIGWLYAAARACSALDPADVDVVLATGPPFIAFRLARRVAEELGRPYVLDYRDLWTGNPHGPRKFDSRGGRSERIHLRDAAAITAVSPSLAKSLDVQFGIGEKVQVVSNGYDAEDLADVPALDFGHFGVVYAGTFYPPKRVIAPVVRALQRLKERARVPQGAWKFHYYGPHAEHVRNAASGSGLGENVVIHGLVARREVLAALRGSGLSVVVTSIEPEGSLEDRSIVTGKIFEAVGLGKPSLVIAPRGSDLEGILRQTGLGRSFTGDQVEEMASFLEECIQGVATSVPTPDLYSWSSIADRLHEVLSAAANVRSERLAGRR